LLDYKLLCMALKETYKRPTSLVKFYVERRIYTWKPYGKQVLDGQQKSAFVGPFKRHTERTP
jgi:hypothetical protein